jgi:uncharacterized membrane protein YqjE
LKLFDLDKLINTLTGYIETRIELLKIDAKESLSVVVTKIVTLSLISVVGIFILFFLFMGLSGLLNQLLESQYLGYLIVAGFFGLVLLAIVALKEKIGERIRARVSEIEEEIKAEIENPESDV